MLVTSMFSVSHNVFYPPKHKLPYSRQTEIVVCKCSQFVQFGQGQNFVVWKRVNELLRCIKPFFSTIVIETSVTFKGNCSLQIDG